jgi:hypothetical protein
MMDHAAIASAGGYRQDRAPKVYKLFVNNRLSNYGIFLAKNMMAA